ncbi:PRD domain-containing protein [Dielma fastidiosa]|uniref:BglG family transcriptional antiterminator n=1 Tax=Dielma fastidiosa TaxID=1034346 RepID=A0A318KME7_9FIRM|nr:PRD domain-containing protein [Dielma fastidiosa]PXX78951.1 BglG family transcriptional antiterminator [Dielma fastidiosa]
MLVKKKINNNFAICLDSNGQEIIAYGKGIGFGKMPYQLEDLSLVERTFYDIDNHMVLLANQIPEKTFEVATKIVDIANLYLNNSFSSNLIFSLADHITFAIDRLNKGIFIANPLGKDINFLYEKELQVGRIALNIVENELGVRLPDKEVTNIAIHFIEAEVYSSNTAEFQSKEQVITEIMDLLEKEMEISIDKNDATYIRFVTHLEYLLKRSPSKVETSSKNMQLFEQSKAEFTEAYQGAMLISDYIYANLKWLPNEEELLYLIIHINRLCSKADCHL